MPLWMTSEIRDSLSPVERALAIRLGRQIERSLDPRELRRRGPRGLEEIVVQALALLRGRRPDEVLVRIECVDGTGCVVRGDDIDTDRIIPARFMKEVTFDDMGRHAFEDDRKSAKGKHPLDDERFSGAEILVVGKNFGCGSSREHAPQALMRFGFKAFVGGSFAEIFAGNCTSLGLPCLTLADDDLAKLMDSVELDPAQTLRVDLGVFGRYLHGVVAAQRDAAAAAAIVLTAVAPAAPDVADDHRARVTVEADISAIAVG